MVLGMTGEEDGKNDNTECEYGNRGSGREGDVAPQVEIGNGAAGVTPLHAFPYPPPPPQHGPLEEEADRDGVDTGETEAR